MSCYMTYVQNMLCNMCHVILSCIRYIMLCYIAYVKNMLYNRTEHVI